MREYLVNNFQRSVNAEMQIPRLKARMASGVTRRMWKKTSQELEASHVEMKMYAEQLRIKSIEVTDKKPDDNSPQFTGLLAYRPLELLYFKF
jgi:hypothetical protein